MPDHGTHDGQPRQAQVLLELVQVAAAGHTPERPTQQWVEQEKMAVHSQYRSSHK